MVEPSGNGAGKRDRSDRARSRRTKRRTRSGRRAIVLNMAPMIDMTFLLFSFVIVTSTFERPEGILAAEMPQQGSAVALPFSPIVIRLVGTGPSFDDFAIQVDRFQPAPRTIAELPDFLRRIQQQPGFDVETPVVIVSEAEVRWDHVVGCWNAALRAGCKNIAFAEP